MFRKVSLREASSPRQLREKYLLSSSLLIEKLEAYFFNNTFASQYDADLLWPACFFSLLRQQALEI